MISKPFALAAIAFAVLSAPVAAACPAPVAGDTPEAIRANQERLVCLQRELAQVGDSTATQFEIDQIGRTLDSMELQRRFDALDFAVPTPPVLP